MAASFFGIREDEHEHLNQMQAPPPPPPASSAATTSQQAPPQKKRRNLPGTPYPGAEVIALSPKTLMATNRFICEVCKKGFQREQNLQLHRRGHNLPWKLKQKNPNDVRRRVYLCPEPTCVHHEPSRALGDLTGIKKHFCRKHGEKKWKCDKCSKRYAVQSDWKAHSKVCGTREYRCDCGTLFSRRDSFITHRAFCDALAQESSQIPSGLNPIGMSHLYGNNNMRMGISQLNSQMSSLHDHSADLLRLNGGGGGGGAGGGFDHLISHSNPSSAFYPGCSSSQDYNEDTQSMQLQTKPYHGMMQLPAEIQTNPNSAPSTAAAAANLFNLSFFPNSTSSGSMSSGSMMDQFSNGNLMNSSYQQAVPQMSATALLQKAAQMGATTSGGSGSGSASLLRGFGSSSSIGMKGGSFRSQMDNESNLQDLMNSLSSGSPGVFSGGGGMEQEAAFGRFSPGLRGMDEGKMHLGTDSLSTRDFLGVGRGLPAQREMHHGIEASSVDGEIKPASRSFGGGGL